MYKEKIKQRNKTKQKTVEKTPAPPTQTLDVSVDTPPPPYSSGCDDPSPPGGVGSQYGRSLRSSLRSPLWEEKQSLSHSSTSCSVVLAVSGVSMTPSIAQKPKYGNKKKLLNLEKALKHG